MNKTADDEVPNAGQGVSDDTEPAEEYEFDQVTDERNDGGGDSVAERFDEPDSDGDRPR